MRVPDAEGLMVEMVEICGVGPGRVPVADGLPVGDCPICTAIAVKSLCVPIEAVSS
jgi:hypothetical protein